MSNTSDQIYPFAHQGNFTQVHNAVIDHVMPQLSANAWKILTYIIRQTVGWHEEQRDIGYRKIALRTGIKSYSTIARAIEELVQFGCITVDRGHGDTASTYRINRDFALPNLNTTTTTENVATEV